MTTVAAASSGHHGGDAAFVALARTVVSALRAGRIEEADARFQEMCEQRPATAGEMLVFPVLIAIQRGDALHALQQVNQHPEDRFPELRALCLRLLDDPGWVGQARALAEGPDPAVGHAMRQLLDGSAGA